MPVSYTKSSSIVDLASASLLQAAECVACTAGTKIMETGWGLGFMGDIATASSFGVAGALSFGGAGAAMTGLGSAGGVASVGVAGTSAAFAAAGVAVATGTYMGMLAATTYVNAVNSAFGTDFATFSNTGPFRELFPDVTGGPGLSALGRAAGSGDGGCR